MCMLLKLNYAKFGVFNLLFKKLLKNLWGSLPPPLGKGRVTKKVNSKFCPLLDDSRRNLIFDIFPSHVFE